MPPKLYYWPRSSATRVQWALEELGIEHEKIRLDGDKAFLRTPEFLAINPNGRIPALVDDGANLFESLAIIMHLGDKYGVERGLWPAPGQPARGEAFSWMVWGVVQLNYYLFEYIYHGLDTAFSLPKEQRSADIAAQSKAGWEKHLAVLDGRLDGRTWILGDAFTLADVALASYVMQARAMARLSLEAVPHVKAWFDRCKTRPAFTRVLAEP
jgi:glutathione S-transferase